MGYQKFLEWCLMAHLETYAHIYVVFIDSVIRKRDIALKTTLSVPLLKWKFLEVETVLL